MVLGANSSSAYSAVGGVRKSRKCQVQAFDHYSSGAGTWVSCALPSMLSSLTLHVSGALKHHVSCDTVLCCGHFAAYMPALVAAK